MSRCSPLSSFLERADPARDPQPGIDLAEHLPVGNHGGGESRSDSLDLRDEREWSGTPTHSSSPYFPVVIRKLPAGIFLPTIAIGAAMGRSAGIFLCV